MKKLIPKIIWCLLFICININFSFADVTKRAHLQGSVVDRNTGKPIHFVNVFLSNTMIGTTTDRNGKYNMSNVPFGTYDLIISMMGYHTEVIQLKLFDKKIKIVDIRLRQKLLEFPEIQVEAKSDKVWEKNYIKFKREFFGNTGNSEKCKIMNPGVLNFVLNKEDGVFSASAQVPLEVVNNALGYKIFCVIRTFRIQGTRLEYYVEPKFENLITENQDQQKRWLKNRVAAYRGSIRHFFHSLINDRLFEEGFVIWSLLGDMKHPIRGDELEKLFSKTDIESEMKIHLPRLVEVKYMREYDDVKNRENQISRMEVLLDSFDIAKAGYLVDHKPLVQHGYWSYERIADLLPYEFDVNHPEK